MIVTGPSGRRVVLPARPGLTYPGHAIVVPRARFDGAVARCRAGRWRASTSPLGSPRSTMVESCSTGRIDRADFVIGADGATSITARTAGLVDHVAGAVGLRRAWLHRGRCHASGHCVVERASPPRFPRLRMAVSRSRRRESRTRSWARSHRQHGHRPSNNSTSSARISCGSECSNRSPARPFDNSVAG